MTTPPQGNPYATYHTGPNPYASQAGYPQTAVPPQQAYGYPAQAGYPAHTQPPVLLCRFCASSPAVQVTFRAHRGLLVVMSFQKLDGMMCATCGLGVYRAMTTQTLWQGWWSPFSLFLFTPFTLIYNLVASRKVKSLQAPAPGTHGQQIDPGEPVYRRPLAYVALIPVLWLVFMIVSGLTQGS